MSEPSLAKHAYRPDELADIAGVSLRTVRRWMSRGLIAHVHLNGVIRIPRHEITRLMRDGLGAKRTTRRTS